MIEKTTKIEMYENVNEYLKKNVFKLKNINLKIKNIGKN